MSTATVSLFAYFAGVMKTRNVVVDMVIIRYEGKGVIEPVDWHYHADLLRHISHVSHMSAAANILSKKGDVDF